MRRSLGIERPESIASPPRERGDRFDRQATPKQGPFPREQEGEIAMRSLKSCLLVATMFVSLAASTGSRIAARADDLATAKNAFQATANFSVGPGNSEVCAKIATVPSGKRLVIQYAGATVGPVPSGQSIRHVQLRTRLSAGPSVFHNLTQVMTNAAPEVLIGQEVTIYADPVATVDLCVARLGGTSGTVPVIGTVSGYLAP
jgi:hypothetical protein